MAKILPPNKFIPVLPRRAKKEMNEGPERDTYVYCSHIAHITMLLEGNRSTDSNVVTAHLSHYRPSTSPCTSNKSQYLTFDRFEINLRFTRSLKEPTRLLAEMEVAKAIFLTRFSLFYSVQNSGLYERYVVGFCNF